MTAPSSVSRAPVLTRGAPSVFIQPMARFEPRPLDPEHIRPRRTAFSFPGSIARHWLAGNPVRTHFFNAINLFVVSFEDFMARVMRGCLPQLQDAEFARQIRGFMGQESTHSFVHAKYLQNMREQGFAIDGYLSQSEHIFSSWFEKKLGQRVSVAMIAGFEHLTSVLAELILEGRMVRDGEPAMAEMWEWHAAEEIEHKTLAFELLRKLSGSYLLRVLGGVLGALVVAGFIGVGLVMLLRQEGLLWRKSTWKQLRQLLFGPDRVVARTGRLFLDYFRPGFHPNQRDTYALAQEVFDRQASRRGA